MSSSAMPSADRAIRPLSDATPDSNLSISGCEITAPRVSPSSVISKVPASGAKEPSIASSAAPSSDRPASPEKALRSRAESIAFATASTAPSEKVTVASLRSW